MDFDEAVNQALGPPTEPKPEKVDKPKKVKVPREEKKRKERDETEERPKKKKTLLPEELEAQKELFAQLVRYCEAFPECAHGLFVHPEAPCEEIEFQLATIQRRINAKVATVLSAGRKSVDTFRPEPFSQLVNHWVEGIRRGALNKLRRIPGDGAAL
jgi:hypothetical protein